jgi:hypothetical protein
MIIRPMETTEIDLVINLFNYYREEAGIPEERYDHDKVLKTIREYCIRPNLFFNVALNGRRPVGIIGGFLSEDPVDTEITATIQFNYLIPEFATVENYGQLIDIFQTWAKQFKVEQIRAIDIGNNITRLDDVYDQLGFNPIRVNIMNKEIQ